MVLRPQGAGLGGEKLGPVGGRIVAEVILDLLAPDPTSYFNADPSFSPGADPIPASRQVNPAAVVPAEPTVG